MFEITGSVEIAVDLVADLVAAGVAMIGPLRQRQFGLDRTAARAGLVNSFDKKRRGLIETAKVLARSAYRPRHCRHWIAFEA
jgi:hypothetical protein